MTVFLGTLWCSIKQIDSPYVFDWQYGIALHAMPGNRASSPGGSWDFLSCGKNLGYILELQWGWSFKTTLCSASQHSCLVTTDTSGIETRFGRIIQLLLEVRWETKHPFLVSTEIYGFLTLFKKSQASSSFEALNSAGLSRYQGM